MTHCERQTWVGWATLELGRSYSSHLFDSLIARPRLGSAFGPERRGVGSGEMGTTPSGDCEVNEECVRAVFDGNEVMAKQRRIPSMAIPIQ
jgi:hypothetical protein